MARMRENIRTEMCLGIVKDNRPLEKRRCKIENEIIMELKCCERPWIGFMWLRIGTSVGLL